MEVAKNREYPSVEEKLWARTFRSMGTFGRSGATSGLDQQTFPDSIPNDICVAIAWFYGISPEQVDHEYEMFLTWLNNEVYHVEPTGNS